MGWLSHSAYPHVMSIRERYRDAQVLAEQGRLEGALVMALICVAATAEKAFPQGTPSNKGSGKMGDAERFTAYLSERLAAALGIKTSGRFMAVQVEGKMLDIETILYRYYRCKLVHEGKVHEEVELDLADGHALMVEAAGPGKFKLGAGIIRTLLHLVKDDPLNLDEKGLPAS